MSDPYHYPPELYALLTDTIPRLCRSKPDLINFFRGAGVEEAMLADLKSRIATDRNSINKFDITRTVLTRLNEGADRTLAQRREVLRRVVEFEEFSTCWPEDQLKAKGLVAEIRRVINVKDSFTRMQQEPEAAQSVSWIVCFDRSASAWALIGEASQPGLRNGRPADT